MSEPMPEKRIGFPEGVEFEVSKKSLRVKGPLGEVSQDFWHAPVLIAAEEREVIVTAFADNKRGKAILGTISSLIENMLKGVTKGFTYRMKVITSHFPVTVKVAGNTVLIENFIGERFPRKANIVGSTNVSVKGIDIMVSGIDKGDVGQTAANIERAVRIRGKDPRKFLDGIYVVEKLEGSA